MAAPNYPDMNMVTEFVQGARARKREAQKDTAGAVVAGVLSAALFTAVKKRR